MSGTPATRDYSHERELALASALALHGPELFTETAQAEDVEAANSALRSTAASLFEWLTGPAIMFLTIGPITEQETGLPAIDHHGGTPMQLRATQQFTATINLADSRGNAIGDQPGTQDDIAWSVEGDENVLTFEVSEDSRTATVKAAGPVGSAVLRAGIGELFVTEAVDVVPGEATLITITTTEPTEQEAEEPTPDPQA